MTASNDDLAAALTAEYAAVFAWGLIGAQTTEDRRALARTALARHEAARTWLRQQYADAGQEAPGAASAYDTGRVTTPEQAAALAVQVELACIPAWSKVAASGDAAQRAYAAAQAQADATRAMTWGAVAAAFPGMSGDGAAATGSASPSTDQATPAAGAVQPPSTGSNAPGPGAPTPGAESGETSGTGPTPTDG